MAGGQALTLSRSWVNSLAEVSESGFEPRSLGSRGVPSTQESYNSSGSGSSPFLKTWSFEDLCQTQGARLHANNGN